MATMVLPISAPLDVTATGTELAELVPFPSWPVEFPPQANTEPSDASAILWLVPAAMPTTDFPASTPVASTAIGAVLLDMPALPSWP